MNRPLVHISMETGHLPSYQVLFLRLLNGTPSTGRLRGARFWRMVRAERVFFCTIDSEYLSFLCIALLRSLCRLETTGLFLRPMQCFRNERRLVYTLKRLVFRGFRRLPGLKLLSIVPFYIEPRLKQICHDWIYDPQLWDLWLDGPPNLPETALSKSIEAERGRRKVMIFIGAGNRIKGFPEFVAQAEEDPDNVLAIVAGRVNPEYKDLSGRLKQLGMIVEDRLVSDDEILSLYKIADFAWCRYAPDYDQASGIFGRALQTRVVPIVREGSLLDRMKIYIFGSEMMTAQGSEKLRMMCNYSRGVIVSGELAPERRP